MTEQSAVTNMIEVNPFKCKKCGSFGEKNFSWDGNCLVCEEEGERLLDDGWHHDSDMEAR